MNYWVIAGIKQENNPDKIIDKVCEVFQVSKELIFYATRKREVVDARRAIIYVLVKKRLFTYEKIGKLLNRDHSTVTHHFKTTENLISTDVEFRKKLNQLNYLYI